MSLRVGGATEDIMGQPLSTEELMRLDAELAARVVRSPNPPPHDALPSPPAPGSNVAYVSKDENARLVAAGLVLGLGRFSARR